MLLFFSNARNIALFFLNSYDFNLLKLKFYGLVIKNIILNYYLKI